MGTESFSSIGSCDIKLKFGTVKFHVLPINTPLLLCITDMNRHNVYLNNLTKKLIQVADDGTEKELPVVMKYGHPWLLDGEFQASLFFDHDGNANTFLTEQ